ncbi:MAG: molybdenum cofactor guanylyltransferase MobA [Hyphomicrobiales bacterium]
MSEKNPVAAVILAGGLARRMGDAASGDKAMLQLGGRPILSHVISRLRPQVEHIAINANGPPERFAQFGLPVVADPVAGFAGPLAGVLAGLDWARANVPDAKWLVSVACDTPFFPKNLVAHMTSVAGAGNADMVCAASGGRHHPVFGLWPVSVADELRQAMIGDEIRKVDLFTARYRLVVAEFGSEPDDPFFNVNRPQDLEHAESITMEALS